MSNNVKIKGNNGIGELYVLRHSGILGSISIFQQLIKI